MQTVDCKKCGLEKQYDKFHKDKRHINGLMSYCKSCHNKMTIESKKRKPEFYRKYMQEYNKTHISPYRISHPNYRKAQYLVAKAIKKGSLIRLPCEKCGKLKSYGHHPFYRYYEPLKVIWLCAEHHKEAHSEEKSISDKELVTKIENKNQQLQRVEKSIDFYLEYHKIPEMARIRIRGNLLMVFRKELAISW